MGFIGSFPMPPIPPMSPGGPLLWQAAAPTHANAVQPMIKSNRDTRTSTVHVTLPPLTTPHPIYCMLAIRPRILNR